jgi:hypothetical protein
MHDDPCGFNFLLGDRNHLLCLLSGIKKAVHRESQHGTGRRDIEGMRKVPP